MAENKLDDQGFIAFPRSIQNFPSWGKKPFTEIEALLSLMFKVTFKKDRRIEGVRLMPGQLFVKKHELARQWGWSRNRVKRFLKRLAKAKGELWAIKEEVVRASTTSPREMVRAIGTRISFIYWDRLMRKK